MVRYPRIPLDSRDVYVYINQGDRYDTLAQAFYSDPSLWWVINRANPSQEGNSLFPTVGSQIRIPAYNRISSIKPQGVLPHIWGISLTSYLSVSMIALTKSRERAPYPLYVLIGHEIKNNGFI